MDHDGPTFIEVVTQALEYSNAPVRRWMGQTDEQGSEIIVVGAGIVGVASAIWLRRAGHEVTLIDNGEPGMGALYGNGAILASCSMVPLTSPGLALKGPKMLLDPNFPLFMRWSYLPKLIPWMARYILNANDKAPYRTWINDDCGRQFDTTSGNYRKHWQHAWQRRSSRPALLAKTARFGSIFCITKMSTHGCRAIM